MRCSRHDGNKISIIKILIIILHVLISSDSGLAAIMSTKKMGNQPSETFDADLYPNEEDLIYEEELLRNPYNMKMWLRYIGARKEASPKKRHVLYERALRALPGSFKVC